MLTYDSLFEITSAADAEYFNELCSNPAKYSGAANRSTTFANLIVSRIKRDRSSTPESDYRVRLIFFFFQDFNPLLGGITTKQLLKQFKVTSHYDPRIDSFVALFQPVLCAANRSKLIENDANCFKTIHDKNLKLVDIQSPLDDKLMLGNSSSHGPTTLYDMIAPESLKVVAKLHRESILKLIFVLKYI